ncbi:hypothetical protein RSOLAG1IB_04821 [Rhizoctonia solani AG-1 IB]|uniref:DUF7918 domain-containing protein n=1 Tax=Thanatephorus cucumeris (strain AG1-IB / isolate 7/3/14) TaxID=1108050 RepID=A0A0B7FXL3_THACB|nr:hypothetical protein RSOLAG1IB_04821 [Rhizoctonia solani AG-1 IB]
MQAILEQNDFAVVIGNADPNKKQPLVAYEFGDEEPIGFIQQCWIPAKPGKGFCIHYSWNGDAEVALSKQAGLFCVIYIDGLVIERAFLPLDDIDDTERNREWEITGKYYRGVNGPTERRFRFIESKVDANMEELDVSTKGTIRVVLYWTKPDPTMEDLFPGLLTKEVADELALHLESPVSPQGDRFQSCVRLGRPRKSKVKENNMKVRPVDDQRYQFIFHYAHPDWLMSKGIIPPKVSSTPHT